MQLISQPVEFKQTLKELNPSKIAVAYVGADWDRYINPAALKEIILSPTYGSNPQAIEAIINKIGIDNVLFLNNLHTKLYLGAQSALLGSCNLSYNGIGGGLEEAAVLINDKTMLAKLNDLYAHYKKAAQQAYPTAKAKIEKLTQLISFFNQTRDKRKQAAESQLAPDETEIEEQRIPTLREYRHVANPIYINCYQPKDTKLNQKVISEKLASEGVIQNATYENVEDFFSDYLHFLEEDNIECGGWSLAWRAKDNGMPYKKTSLSWTYIDVVIPNGAAEEEAPYTKVVAKLEGKERPSEPFKIDAEASKVIKAALRKKEFKDFRGGEDDESPWSVPSLARTANFFAYIEKHYDELLKEEN